MYSTAEELDADALWVQMTARTAEIEAGISVSVSGSAAARFNEAAAGTEIAVDETAYGILQTAAAMYAETGGAYNPATGLLVDLWGFSPRHRAVDYRPSLPYDRQNFEETLPEQKFIDAFSASAMADFSSVILSETDGGYSIAKPAAVASVDGRDYSRRISLDGIGKGASVDAAAEILRTAGVKYGYYNAGGSSLCVLENPSRQDGIWEITVNSPREELGTSYATLSVKNTTVSTSGDYEQYYEIGGTRYSHIIGKDCKPVGAGSHILCATVVGGSAAEGDARATALVTMSAAEGGFEGERAYHAREISVKFHCLKDAGTVRRVTVNGEEVPFKQTKRDAGAFPLDTSLSAPDAYVVGVSFLADVAKEQSVVFFCE